MYKRREFLQKFLTAAGGAYLLLNSKAMANVSKALAEIPHKANPQTLASDENFWNYIQNSFDVDRTVINLNNGGISPSPETVHSALKKYLDFTNKLPAFNLWRKLEPEIEQVREKIAESFGCDPEEIAITRNASESLETIQFGIDYKPGDEIITTDQDYQRMLITWEQIARRYGVILKKTSYPTPLLNKNDLLEKIEAEISEKTKLIHVSHVIYLTGQILPIKEISKIAHKNGIPIICDGAHSFSHFPFKLKDLECDFFGASLHKWTYAPIGTGFLYVKKELINKIWPLMGAPKSKDDDIRKFEEIGTHPAANHNAIIEAIEFNNEIGLERKAERLRYLNLRWINRIKDFDNVHFMTDVKNESNWCGIICVGIEGIKPGKIARYLMKQHKIFVIPIRHSQFAGIRVSPNVYSKIEGIDKFADVMENIAQGKITSLFD